MNAKEISNTILAVKNDIRDPTVPPEQRILLSLTLPLLRRAELCLSNDRDDLAFQQLTIALKQLEIFGEF